jgi:hypothetical protein
MPPAAREQSSICSVSEFIPCTTYPFSTYPVDFATRLLADDNVAAAFAIAKTEKPRNGAFHVDGRSVLIREYQLVVSPAACLDLTTNFPGGKFFRVDVGVSRSIADRSN